MATGLLNQMLGQAPRAANPGYPPHSQDAAGAYTAFAALRNVAGIQSHPLLNAMQVSPDALNLNPKPYFFFLFF